MKNWKKRLALVLSILAASGCLFYFYLIFYGGTDLHFNSKAEKGDIRVACVGDSITYGALIPNWYFNNYPRQLDELLGEGYHVANFGATDRTASSTGDNPYTDEKIYRESLSFQPDIVVLMLGTNDAKPHNWPGKKQFEREYEKLVDSYLKLESDPTVFIAYPPSIFYVKDMKMGPEVFEAVKDTMEEEREIVYKIADKKGLQIIDMHTFTAAHPEWFRHDGVHPDAEGAKAIAERVYDHVKMTL